MIGILLTNLGTPASPSTSDVRKYLREFLMDPRVIDISSVGRWLLVNGIIAPFRSPKSAKAYQSIWMEQGSPLLHYTKQLTREVQMTLGSTYQVEFAMRYGQPSLESALAKFRNSNVKEIRILPLYPQYASSTTESTTEKVLKIKKKDSELPELQFLPPFFDHPDFLKSFAQVGKISLEEFNAEHILFSFHGLPERHILKEDISGKHCLKSADCCEKIIPANGLCYRAHCFQTAYGIANELQLQKKQYTICFQSRLGRTPWIQPFTDIRINQLAEKGIKRLAVFCPSFVSDCLETLEEIGIRAKEHFIEKGGEDLLLVPSLNTNASWVQCVSKMVAPEKYA